jgi:tetratricopeptide (TPR) repeat protein
MRGKLILFTLIGVLIGFIAGFLVANSINRSEINNLKSDVGKTNSADLPSQDSTKETLSTEEIRAKINEADENPENLTYQKNLGLALYRYGAIKNDPEIIAQAARLLDRAIKLSPDDVDLIIGSGNAWFDIGYIKKDNQSFEKARSLYEKVLSNKPNDVGVRTDLGMTYFLETPPNDQKAVEEFRRSLAVDPKNEKALEFIVQSYSRLGDAENARKYLSMLKEANPSNPAIAGLSSQIGPSSSDPK